jgi:hypothetical protein
MDSSGKQRIVGHLQELYTVVVGVALAVALSNLIDQQAEVPFRRESLPYFLAYIVTLVPLYHGALRHLDITFLEEPVAQTRPGAFMVDWGLLFVESCGLLALALLINKPVTFMFTLLALLAFDTIWGFTAYLAFSPALRENRAEGKWATINFVAVIVLIMAIVLLHSLDPSARPVATYRWVIIVVITVARTVSDYVWCWSYYYPAYESKEPIAPNNEDVRLELEKLRQGVLPVLARLGADEGLLRQKLVQPLISLDLRQRLEQNIKQLQEERQQIQASFIDRISEVESQLKAREPPGRK